MRTDGFENWSAASSRYTPEYVEQVTGVPAEDVRRAARVFGGADSAAIIYGGGVTRSTHGTDTVKALANLALLTGNVERKGTGLYALQARNNAQGACDMGAMPELLPGYRCIEDGESRLRFEERWGTRCPRAPADRGRDDGGSRGGAHQGHVHRRGEPRRKLPRSAAVERGLTTLDFLLVQDIFLTETAALATVVLPAASFAEKDGTFTNFEGRVQAVRQALPPLGDSRPDWEIMLALAAAMGSPLPFETLNDIEREISGTGPLLRGL